MSNRWRLVLSGSLWCIPTFGTAWALGITVTDPVLALLILSSIFNKICDRIAGVQ